jgi:carboxypeptidase Q
VTRVVAAVVLAAVLVPRPSAVAAQTLAGDDPVLRAIWTEATARSRLGPLAQALLDSLGPRLTGSPGMERAQDWAVRTLREWDIDAQLEAYGTWEGWERGTSRADLVSPRVRSLEGQLLAWSPGTGGEPLEAEVTYLPQLTFRTDWDRFLDDVAGKWAMLSFAQPTCRPDEQWARYQMDDSALGVTQERLDAEQRWSQGLLAAAAATGEGRLGTAAVHAAVERAGAVGVITSQWPGVPGTARVMDAANRDTPTFELSCEDYGLVHRLAAAGQGPVLRLTASAEALGEVPVYNVVGHIRGSERPDEYVILSAHFDSWDGASGATDNGAGALEMLEAARVLAAAYPRPRRTILVTLWSGEEQGLIGSRAFVEDHPEVVEGLQILLNRDSGTGRVTLVSAQGLVDVGAKLEDWLARVPEEVARHVELERPGTPSGGGSDYSSFVCMGAPGIPFGSLSWDYSTHTWHSNRDTLDKLVFDDLRNNVVLVASLAYLASEEPELVGRTRRELGSGGGGWPACGRAARSSPNAPTR